MQNFRISISGYGRTMALSRSSIGKLAVSGYPGHIFVCKLRYGYGHQEYIEKLEILHSWYSDLNAYLPVLFKSEPEKYIEKKFKILDKQGKEVCLSLNDLMNLVGNDIDGIYDEYDPVFEGQDINSKERLFIKTLRSIKEQLDTITAAADVISGIKTDDSMEAMG